MKQIESTSAMGNSEYWDWYWMFKYCL